MQTNQDQLVLDPAAEEALRRSSTATIATQLFRRGFRQQFLVGVALVPGACERWVGRARTLRFIPAREDLETLESLPHAENLQWSAVEALEPGEVLVIDSNSSTEAASAGDMLLTRAMLRGAAAVVTDGAFRDGSAIKRLGIPAYARANTATTRLARFHVADTQVPIGCAGVAVYPGDVVVGDEDGVVIIPQAVAADVAFAAAEQERLEEYLHGRIQRGESLWGVYPPNESTLEDYRDWVAGDA